MLKKIIFTISLFFNFISFSAKLTDVSYKNGEFTLTFDSKINKPIIENTKNSTSNNTTYMVNEIKLKDSSISSDVSKTININDEYYKRIVIDNISNNSIGIFSYSQFGYSSNVTYNNNTITIKQIPITVPKRISSLTNKQLVIVLDAGHGGHDSGAIGFGKREKDLALKVVKKLEANLKRDHKIILTRNDDTFISLSNRPQISNNNSADLFISIHLNASNNTNANGAEIFYFSKESNPYVEKLIAFEEKADKEQAQKVSLVNQILGDFFIAKTKEKSAKLAEVILDNFVKEIGLKKRGVFGANFAVLRGSESASILIELGFITNKSDNKILSSEASQTAMAISIADSIRENFEE